MALAVIHKKQKKATKEILINKPNEKLLPQHPFLNKNLLAILINCIRQIAEAVLQIR